MMVVHTNSNGTMDSSHPHVVLSRLSEQRTQGLFCDVTVVVEDIKFHAHRNVLAATSRYFRNAFTASTSYMPNQVLEIQDLKSEVFATILDFIYSSRLSGNTDDKSIGAAGKKLGIPFLEKLLEIDTSDSKMAQSQALYKSETSLSQTKLSGNYTLKNEVQRAEEQDCTKGPRITNAFSITEVPVDLHSNDHQSPDIGNQTGIPGMPSVEGDSVGAMSEHSYAVSKGHQPTDNKEKVQQSDKSVIKPAVIPSKTLSSHKLGPLKKRHRLCKGLGSNETSAVIQTPDCSPVVENGPPDSTSMLQTSDSRTDSCSAPDLLPPPEILPLQESDPPSLIPEDVPTSTTYRCLQCPEAFSSSALLTIHMQIHKRRFVSHLFCKYCHKKFIHLKRLRNHEQGCLKGPPQLEPKDKEASGSVDLNDTFSKGDAVCPSPDLESPPVLDPTLTSTSDPPQDEFIKPNSRPRSYKCSMCKRAYVTLSSLKRHENVHSWQRAYPCHYCNKVFALAEYRTKHEIWHTGERRYQCIFCLETFLTYYILRNHQKSFHGVDPRLSMKKSANGTFKGSAYPIKLYRLLPMKFRKKSYKTYSQTYSEVVGNQEHSLNTLADTSSKTSTHESTIPVGNSEGSVSGQSLFSMPVTFMATPKMVATEMPRITFGQSFDHSEETPSEKNAQRDGFQIHSNTGLASFQSTVSPVFGYGYTKDSANKPRNDMVSTEMSSETNKDLPFLNIPPVCSFEGLSKLSELSAAAQTIEEMANQLLQPLPESQEHNVRPDRMTETYIAKPACPGPSIDNQVLPLCQITVKIGNEAIVRRKIKGSKLFPKKKKKRTWRPDDDQCKLQEDTGFPNLRLRPEIPISVVEDEQYEDASDPEHDKLWRPYYTYKPKKKGKALRSRKRTKPVYYYTKPVSPEPDDDCTDMDGSPEESVPAKRFPESTEVKMGHSDRKEDFTCRRCSRSFSTPSSLNMHIISCHQPRCKICAKLCPVEELSNVDRAEGFICRTCTEDGSCFNSDVMSRTLSCEKRYRCSYCPQRFLYLATKKSHEAKHLEKFAIEHSCRYCPKVCKSAAQLSLHENKHLAKGKEVQSTENHAIFRSPSSESKLPESSAGILPIAPKAELLEMDSKIHNKASLSFPCKSRLHYPADQHKKNKRKCLLEVSKDYRFDYESEEQNLPKSSPITQLNPCSLFPAGLSRVPAKSLKTPKSEWLSCKEEPAFHPYD